MMNLSQERTDSGSFHDGGNIMASYGVWGALEGRGLVP